jgi:hypothetical protein
MIIMTRFFLLAVTLLLASCAKNDIGNPVCDVANPVKDLPWLKAEIEGNYATPNDVMDYIVYRATLHGATVFYTDICCPVCNTSPPFIKNCAGETIGQMSVSVDRSELKNVTVIWHSNNGVCP